jgi:hypothetical protein
MQNGCFSGLLGTNAAHWHGAGLVKKCFSRISQNPAVFYRHNLPHLRPTAALHEP